MTLDYQNDSEIFLNCSDRNPTFITSLNTYVFRSSILLLSIVIGDVLELIQSSCNNAKFVS